VHQPPRAHSELTVLDPFLGIGTAAVAAQQCGVSEFIGFDLDEEYLAEAVRRTGGPEKAASLN
jgi:DNA modification methylase